MSVDRAEKVDGFDLKRMVALAISLLIAFAAAGVGGIASVNARDFYSELLLPTWAPPGWLFGPVWSLLYTLMGIAAWRVWCSPKRSTTALVLYGWQLMVNALWSWLFFAWQLGFWSFAEVLLLWFSIAATMVFFWRADRIAALLLVPYLLWVTFASALTWSIWQLNPQIL